MRVLGLILLAVFVPAIGLGLRPAAAPERPAAVAGDVQLAQAERRRLNFGHAKPRAALPGVAPKAVAPLQAAPVAALRPRTAEKIWQQSEIAVAAAIDAASLPDGIKYCIRYVDLGNLPTAAERADYLRVLSGHANLLSREPDITTISAVPNTDFALARINIADYRWEHIWESLRDEEPFYYVTVESKTVDVVQVWAGGIWPDDGQYYAPGAFKWQGHKVVKERAIAPQVAGGAITLQWPGGVWIDGNPKPAGKITVDAVSYLVGALQSKTPIVCADWLLNSSAIQEGREGRGYYDFLKINNEGDFFKLVGYDAKLAEPFGKEIREAVSDSGVTLQPRAIWRDNSQGGGVWRTMDFIKAVDKKNPLRILGKDIEKFADAHENFGHIPNGGWATGVFNGKGARQNAAPNTIANADKAPGSNDTAIHVNYSCLKCHRQGGLQDIAGWARNLFAPPLALQSPDYREYLKIKRQYLRDMAGFIVRDRAIYTDFVKQATGWTAEEFSDRYAAAFEKYEYGRVGLVQAARYARCQPEHLKAAIQQQIKLTGGTDLVLSGFLLEGARAETVGIRQLEELMPLLHAALRGVRIQ